MSAVFCGNPQSHGAHEGTKGYCEGVHREERKEEVVIEKFEPKVDATAIHVNAERKALGLPPAEPEFDPVKIPAHYNQGTIEVTNFIADQGLNFPRGNVVKYVARAGKKDPSTELQDLEKAAAYLQMAYNLAQGKPAVVRDPETREVVWTLFKN